MIAIVITKTRPNIFETPSRNRHHKPRDQDQLCTSTSHNETYLEIYHNTLSLIAAGGQIDSDQTDDSRRTSHWDTPFLANVAVDDIITNDGVDFPTVPDYQVPSNHVPHTYSSHNADPIDRPPLGTFDEERASSIHDPGTEVPNGQTKEQRKRDCHQLQNIETLMINELDGDDDPTVAEFIELSASDMDLDYERDGSLARRRDMDTADRPGAPLADDVAASETSHQSDEDDEVTRAVDLPGTTKKKRRTTRKPRTLNGWQRQSLAKKKHTDQLNTTREDDD